MKNKIIIILIILFGFAQVFSQTYSIKQYVMGSSAQTISNDQYSFKNTVGQFAIGKTENANNKINSGFWFPQEQQECNISIFNVTGGGNYCLGGEGVQVGLDSSQTGILYQLKRDGNNVGNPIVGNGNPFSFGEQTEAGTYTVLASDTVNNCELMMNGNAIITILPLPTATISGTTSLCIGDTAELSVALTGTAPFSLEFSDGFTANNIETSPYVRQVNPAQTTQYSITEVSDVNCSNTGTGAATITVNPLPTATISGTTSICAGESAELSVALTGTAPFSLEFSDGFTANNIETSPYVRQVNPAQTTQYSITEVSDVNCSNTGTGTATITVNSLPTAYNVTGGGSYYEGGEGVEVGLDGSEIGINYELFVNNETTDVILNGTGNPLNFGNQTIEGIYTVTATLAEGNCSREMIGSAEVIILPLANQEISINAGWNIISSYINPENSNIEEIFSGMDNLVIVKNGSGQIYSPNQGINQIGEWNIVHGYMVYVTSPATLEISGTAIVPNETQINLVTGWNLIAYLRNSQISIETALGSITNSIVLVKDNQGNIYFPGYYLNTIGSMQPGKGYWFYMNAPAVLTYPGN